MAATHRTSRFGQRINAESFDYYTTTRKENIEYLWRKRTNMTKIDSIKCENWAKNLTSISRFTEKHLWGTFHKWNWWCWRRLWSTSWSSSAKFRRSTRWSTPMRYNFITIHHTTLAFETRNNHGRGVGRWLVSGRYGIFFWKMLHVTHFQHIPTDIVFFSALLFRAQNSTCMCHDSGAISSFLLVILRVATVEVHECGGSIAGAPTLANLGVEAQTRMTQLDQGLQQGGRTGTAAGQVPVFSGGRTNDGGEKSMGSIGALWWKLTREPPTRSCQRTGRVQKAERMFWATKQWRVRGMPGVCSCIRFDLVVHGKSSGSHRKCIAQHGGVATSLSCVFSKEQCNTFCDYARGVCVSFRHVLCGEQSGDDGTADQRAREIREHLGSGIPEDWHRDSWSRGRTDEDASHYELAQTGNIPRHQDRSDERQGTSECSDGKIGRCERIQGCFQRF